MANKVMRKLGRKVGSLKSRQRKRNKRVKRAKNIRGRKKK